MSASTIPALNAGTPIIQQVLAHILESADGQTVTGSDLAHIADRKTVESALRTLRQRGEVVRILPGVFAKPLPFGFEPRRRALIGLVGAAFAQTGHIAVPDGPTSAFELGLVSQAPILASFLTTAEDRVLEIGRVRVALVNADPWWFALHDRPAGTVVRGLGWAGSSRVAEAWRALRPRLAQELIEELRAEASRLPLWLTAALSEAPARGDQ